MRGDFAGQGVLVDQRLVQPAREAVAQRGGDQVHLGIARLERCRAVVDQVDLRELHRVAQGAPDDAVQLDRRRVAMNRLGSARQRPEQLGDHRLDLGRLEIPRHDQRGVTGHVILGKEILDIVDRRRDQVLVGSNHGDVVRMSGRKHQFRNPQLGRSVRPGLVALAAFVPHHLALLVQFLLVHLAAEVLQAVCVEPEQGFQQVGWTVGEIVGAVLGGRGIVPAAAGFHELVKFAARDAFGAHEHQVLEQVGKSRSPGYLVLAAHVVPEIDRRHRQPVVLVQDHGQAVGQLILFVFHVLSRQRTRCDQPRGARHRGQYPASHRGSPPWEWMGFQQARV